MDEQKWLSAAHSLPLLRFATTRFSGRKLRLFACGCARSQLHLFSGIDAAWILETAERVADPQLGGADDWMEAHSVALENRLRQSNADESLAQVLEATVYHEAMPAALDALGYLFEFQDDAFGYEDEEGAIALVREVFGNPFRPVDFASWRTDNALSLARQMYDSRDFGAMPILADALQDAGCDNADVLNHCRDTSATHFRGCWVVDGVLGLQ